MQLTVVPGKLVEVSNLTVADGRARRLFILADGKRSLAQIFEMIKIEAHEGIDIVKMMLEAGWIRLLNSGAFSSEKALFIEEPTHSVSADDFVSGMTTELSKYIGPVASIVMGDFDLSEPEIDKNTKQSIVSTVVEEIDDPEDQQKFLIAVQKANWF
jgi:hypothetical protein